jgi:hypothetical protein
VKSDFTKSPARINTARTQISATNTIAINASSTVPSASQAVADNRAARRGRVIARSPFLAHGVA